jgi:GTP cyclohydrolase II
MAHHPNGAPNDALAALPKQDAHHKCKGENAETCVQIVAVARLPTRLGEFKIVAFHSPTDNKEHAALVRGDVVGKSSIPTRLHSECLTGDAFGSLRCDCRAQLEASMKSIAKLPEGIILYLRQEGRGIGLANKIKAYQLQDEGLDTMQANEALGFLPDERDYEIAAHMLRSLQVKSVRVMSNNPEKLRDLAEHGIKIDGRIPVVTRPTRHNRFYLETKRTKGGHLLGKTARPRLKRPSAR